MRALPTAFFLILIVISNLTYAHSKQLNNNCVKKSDEEYRKLILGNWTDKEELRFSNDIIYVGKQRFLKNGDLILTYVDKSYPKHILVTHKAKWEIKAGKLYEYAVSSSSPEFDLGNSSSVDEILCLNDHLLKLKDEHYGDIFYRIR